MPPYRLVHAQYEMFAASVAQVGAGALPLFVKDELEAYLDCGILAKVFLRMRCGLRARHPATFSCKRSGVRPACGTRRIAVTAAYLLDHILPRVPVRQWALSFPILLRSLFAVHPDLIAAVLRIIQRVINSRLLKQAGIDCNDAATDAIALIQRFLRNKVAPLFEFISR